MAYVPKETSEMPEVYGLWIRCKDFGGFYYTGALADQPYILMMEFDVCRATNARFQDSLADLEARLRPKS